MSPPNDIPRFIGEEGPEEAEKWLGIVLTGTGSFTESGVFRLIRSKFPVGSLTRAWFDGLEDTTTLSWKDFEARFYHRWIATDGQQEWEAFGNHILLEEMIFEKDPDVEVTHKRICLWVDDHLQLGISTRREDVILIDRTKQLLPPFIRAYLKAFVESEPQSFETLCNEIKGVSRQILDYELTRRSFSTMEWSPVIESHVRQILEKVDQLIKTKVEGKTIDPIWSSSTRGHPSIDTAASTESLDWQACSPLTSALSGVGFSTVSRSSTPVLQSTELSGSPEVKQIELGLDETSDPGAANHISSPGNSFPFLYRIPQMWRKPKPLKRRDELNAIAQQAIDFIDNYGADLIVTWSQSLNFVSAIAIRDKFIDSRRYVDKNSLPRSSKDEVYYHLLLSMCRVYRYYAYQTNWYRHQPVKDWVEHGESSDSTKAIIKADTDKIRISDHDHYLHLTPSGVPSLLGGLFAPDLEKGHALVSSVRTVLFMTLSSYLAEMTGERKYADIASLGANCIKHWMLHATTHLIKDCLIDAQTTQEHSGAYLSCHLTGITIEGFTVLASVTGEDNWRTLAIEVAKAAMCYEPWHSPEGILTLGEDRATSENTNDKTFKGLLNRGLMVAYERNRSNEPFCNMVRCYINVQFNALYELSRLQSAYGMDWRGPYAGPHAHAQIAAFDTIVAALGVSED